MQIPKDVEARLEKLASSSAGDFLVEYLDLVKNYVADVRNPMNIEPAIENQVRKATCDVIDSYIVRRIKVLSGKLEESTDEWNWGQ